MEVGKERVMAHNGEHLKGVGEGYAAEKGLTMYGSGRVWRSGAGRISLSEPLPTDSFGAWNRCPSHV